MLEEKKISSEKRIDTLRKMGEVKVHETSLKFLNEHNGIRPGKVHLLIASSGSGKSALMRKIIKDTIKSSRCLVWLSEESDDEFSETFTRQDVTNKENIRIIDESSVTHDDKRDLFNKFKMACIGSFDGQGAEVVFFDNITTSEMLPSRIDDVSRFHIEIVNFFKDTLRSDTPMALWVIAHTKKEIPQRNYHKLLSIEDIRGAQTICNRVQHAYTLQLFSDSSGRFYSIIKTHKQRGYDMSSKFYSLIYNPLMKTFQNDVEVPFSYVKGCFDNREKL